MTQRTAYAFPVIIDPETGTVTAAAGAATLNTVAGKITTEALTQAQGATYTLTLTNASIAAADGVMVTLAWGTNSQASPIIHRVTPAAGSCVIVVKNMHDSAVALNGTLVLSYVVIKS